MPVLGSIGAVVYTGVDPGHRLPREYPNLVAGARYLLLDEIDNPREARRWYSGAFLWLASSQE